MTWFRVDDGLHSHRKAVRAGVEAMGLWALAGSWASDQLTDGWVPDYIAARIDPLHYLERAQRLVDVGLWVPGERRDEKGWNFHEWLEQQPSRAQVLAERKAAAERQRRARERAKAKREAASHAVSHGASHTSPYAHASSNPADALNHRHGVTHAASENPPENSAKPGQGDHRHAVTHAGVTPVVTAPPTRPDPKGQGRGGGDVSPPSDNPPWRTLPAPHELDAAQRAHNGRRIAETRQHLRTQKEAP